MIVTAARAWLGTPFLHQGAVRGVGCDCLGLLRGVWRDVAGADEPEAIPAYRADWHLSTPDLMADALARHLSPVERAEPGDILAFRLNGTVRHCAILATPETMIHAWSGGSVVETAVGNQWTRRLAGAHRFNI